MRLRNLLLQKSCDRKCYNYSPTMVYSDDKSKTQSTLRAKFCHLLRKNTNFTKEKEEKKSTPIQCAPYN